jgi:hypothetical protein
VKNLLEMGETEEMGKVIKKVKMVPMQSSFREHMMLDLQILNNYN